MPQTQPWVSLGQQSCSEPSAASLSPKAQWDRAAPQASGPPGAQSSPDPVPESEFRALNRIRVQGLKHHAWQDHPEAGQGAPEQAVAAGGPLPLHVPRVLHTHLFPGTWGSPGQVGIILVTPTSITEMYLLLRFPPLWQREGSPLGQQPSLHVSLSQHSPGVQRGQQGAVLSPLRALLVSISAAGTGARAPRPDPLQTRGSHRQQGTYKARGAFRFVCLRAGMAPTGVPGQWTLWEN